MTLEGIDCASRVSNPATVKAAGKHFVCRYVSTPGNPKNLTKSEADALKAAGLGIVVVFETVANRILGGAAAGHADALSAAAQVRVCGAPVGSTIYFACDFDATPAEQAPINAYLEAAAGVLGKQNVGIYGGFYPVSRARAAGVCAYGWQTYAWSGGQWSSAAQLQQYSNGHTVAGLSVDLDRAVAADYGQWQAPAPKPTPPPPASKILNQPRVLHPGMSGRDVYAAKRALRKWATATHHPSPILWPVGLTTYNDATVKTVRDFQEHHAIVAEPDRIGPVTWRLLQTPTQYFDAYGRWLVAHTPGYKP